MTDLLSRPLLKVSPPEIGGRRQVVLPAILAALWAVVAGLVLCLALSVVAWFSGDTGSFGDAVRVGALAWLVGQGGGLHVGGVAIGIIPLGFTILSAAMLYRGGRWAASSSFTRSMPELAVGALAMGGTYLAAGLLVLVGTRSGSAAADLPRTILATFGLGLVAGGCGLLRGSGRAAALTDRLPDEARAALFGGLAGAAAMLCVSSLLVTVSLVVHFSDAVKVAEGMHSGLVGGILLALIGAALVPNAIVFGGSYLTGAGFAVGTGTQVAPSTVHIGSLPGFPLLAALPHTHTSAGWQTVLVAVPLLCGGVAGGLALRRFPVGPLDRAALRGTLAAAVGGVGFVGLAALSGGSVGPGRMQTFGPDLAEMLLVCGVSFMLGGALTAIAYRGIGMLRAGGGMGRAAQSTTDEEPTVSSADDEPTIALTDAE